MPNVTLVEFDGSRHTLEVPEGQSIMQTAVDHSLPGIVGECCGSMACATCHCFIDADWTEKVGPPSQLEQDLLEGSPVETQTNSRLGCQVAVTAALDGLIVHLPESQF